MFKLDIKVIEYWYLFTHLLIIRNWLQDDWSKRSLETHGVYEHQHTKHDSPLYSSFLLYFIFIFRLAVQPLLPPTLYTIQCFYFVKILSPRKLPHFQVNSDIDNVYHKADNLTNWMTYNICGSLRLSFIYLYWTIPHSVCQPTTT